MNKPEKVLLLELLLKDIRLNWNYKVEERLNKALEIAKELQFDAQILKIEEFMKNKDTDEIIGSYFRCNIEDGGYIGMEFHHQLSYSYMNKSVEFKSAVDSIFVCAEFLFTTYKVNY